MTYFEPIEDTPLDKVDENALKLIPVQIAVKYCLIPIRREGRKLRVAMCDPDNTLQVDELKMMTGFDIDPFESRPLEIITAIRNYYEISEERCVEMRRRWMDEQGIEAEVPPAMDPIVGAADAEGAYQSMGEGYGSQIQMFDLAVKGADNDDAIYRLVEGAMQRAWEIGASEIHFVSTRKESDIRFRVNGSIFTESRLPANIAPQVFARLNVLTGFAAHTQNYGDVDDFKPMQSGGECSYSMLPVPVEEGRLFIIRLQDDRPRMKSAMASLDDGKILQRLELAVALRRGLILFTSPMFGPAKEVMSAFASTLRPKGELVLCSSSMISGRNPEIQVLQIDPTRGLSRERIWEFVRMSRAEIVLVEEIGDDALGMRILQYAANRLVIATSTASTLASAIAELPFDGNRFYRTLSTPVSVVAIQRLHQLCPKCRKLDPDGERKLRAAGVRLDDRSESIETYLPVGCESCNQRGYAKHTFVSDFIRVDEDIMTAILEKIPPRRLNGMLSQRGVHGFRDTALRLVLDGWLAVDDFLAL